MKIHSEGIPCCLRTRLQRDRLARLNPHISTLVSGRQAEQSPCAHSPEMQDILVSNTVRTPLWEFLVNLSLKGRSNEDENTMLDAEDPPIWITRRRAISPEESMPEQGCTVEVPVHQVVVYGWYDNELGSFTHMLGERTITVAGGLL
jgi:hypothetical protein